MRQLRDPAFPAQTEEGCSAKDGGRGETGRAGEARRSARRGGPDDRLEKLITRLKNNTAPRPKKKSSLLAHINTAFGNKLTDAEQAQLLAMLVTRSVLRIEAKERVAYG